MTKEEFLQKYYTKMPPGPDGVYKERLLKKNWDKDKGDKPSENEFKKLLKEINGK
jgi:hypothetical protein